MKRAVFRGLGDIALVLWVVRADEDTVYVTDDTGIAEMAQVGQSGRIVGMAKERAFGYDGVGVTHGAVAEWDRLPPFSDG